MALQSKWQQLPTEAINPATLGIDKLSPAGIIDLMLDEDRKIVAAVAREKERIALGVEIISQALRKGGRLVFVGAGTSGRLGVLEAAEMPPTFGTDPALVHAIMAGGTRAVAQAREGVEDNYEEGSRSVARLRPTSKDVVVGVSASGMTPFVRGALNRARKAGAKILFVTCFPGTELQTFVDLTIAPAVGPEVIAGSTRLKAGTATKMVLNMLTTAAMVRIGKTYGNLMVDVQTGSEKLKDRARRILTIVSGIDYEAADRLLKRAHWNVKAAIVMQKTGLPYRQALSKLRNAEDLVRDAIGEDIEPRLRHLLAQAVEKRARRTGVSPVALLTWRLPVALLTCVSPDARHLLPTGALADNRPGCHRNAFPISLAADRITTCPSVFDSSEAQLIHFIVFMPVSAHPSPIPGLRPASRSRSAWSWLLCPWSWPPAARKPAEPSEIRALWVTRTSLVSPGCRRGDGAPGAGRPVQHAAGAGARPRGRLLQRRPRASSRGALRASPPRSTRSPQCSSSRTSATSACMRGST